jgi:hypothetical protein
MMPDEDAQQPSSPQPPREVPLEERGVDLNTVFTGVAALGSVASAGAAWYATTRPPSPPSQDPPTPPPPKVQLPPGVNRPEE